MGQNVRYNKVTFQIKVCSSSFIITVAHLTVCVCEPASFPFFIHSCGLKMPLTNDTLSFQWLNVLKESAVSLVQIHGLE